MSGPTETAPRAVGEARLLGAVGAAGAAVMITELTATRLFAPWFGASIFAWTNVVAVVLCALAAGAAIGGRRADAAPSATTLAKALLLAAAWIAAAAFGGVKVAAAFAPSASGDPASHVGALVGGSLAAGALVFGPPLFLLGWTGPFAVRLLSDAGVGAGAAAGRVAAASTFGSLVGTYLPAFVLLERTGSRGAILVAAAALILAAALLRGLGGGTRAATLAAIAFVGGSGAAVAAEDFVAPAPGETLVADFESAYQYVRVSDHEGPRGRRFRHLSLDEGRGEFHSRRALDGAAVTDAYYDHLAALPDWIAESERRPIRALVIGGGAGTLRGLLRGLQGPRTESVTDVEIDPAVAALAPEFGGAATPPDRVLTADGRTALRSADGSYDLVVLDAYARQIAVPAHLGTKETFEEVRAKLTPRGLFAMNVSVADLESPLARALIRTLHAVFPHPVAIPVEGSWNVILVGGPMLDPRRVPVARGDALDPVRAAIRRRLIPAPVSADGLLLVDDCAPLESLARRIK